MVHKILVVDDDGALLDLITEALKAAGFEVHPCLDCGTALESLRRDPPDLILLDVMLPGQDGFSFCEFLRQEEKTAIPIIFITAKGDLKSRLKGFEIGGQDYIQKPFSLAELRARVGVQFDVIRSRREVTDRIDEMFIRDRVRRDTTDMIVHDLKHPLTCIHGTMALVRNSGMVSDERHQKLLKISETMADMMLLMINDILDVAQAEHRGLKVREGDLDVEALCKKLAMLFQPRFKEVDLVFKMPEGGAPAGLRTDVNLVFRMLANLISNALKMSAVGTAVVVEFSAAEGKLLFSVTDRGPGLSAPEKERVFGKFETGGDESSSGSGIGLTFCRVAAEALGGRVWVEDAEGGGCRFLVSIPAGLPKD